MKKSVTIRETLLQITLVASVILIASCGYYLKPEDTKNVAEEQNEENFNNNKKEKDAQFLVNAAEMDLRGIQLGKLAQQKGNTSYIRELGEMMEETHTKSLNDLTALAERKRISIPTSSTDNVQKAYKRLNEKSGSDFDKAYADMMVDEHKDAIKAFEEASIDSKDTDIKNWAAVSLPGLRANLDHSRDSQDKCNRV